MLAMKLHEKLQKLCDERGWGQSNLLERLPTISKSTISNWWKGKHRPDLESALIIARSLDVTLDYLADDAQDKPAPPEYTEEERDIIELVRDLELTRQDARKRLATPISARTIEITQGSADGANPKRGTR